VSGPSSGSRRGRWTVITLLLVAAGVTARAAVLAADPPAAIGGAVGAALGKGSGAAAAGGKVVAAAPVVAPSGPAGVRSDPVAPAPAAPVGSAYDIGSAFTPTRLALPGGRSARITPVGLHRNGALVIPDDPRVVGWWMGSSKPGEPFGTVVVAGHVDSATRGIGVLAVLPTLRPGQVVELTAGRRSVRYTILSGGLVPQARLSASGVFRSTGTARLVLVTCGGAFDPVRHHYADNYVVVAEPS
jgi:hypothetical protein